MTPLPYSSDVERFSRPWWFAHLRGAVVISIITVVVWIYADARLTEQKTFSATVELTPAAGYVVEPPLRRTVSFTLSGSRSGLEAFHDKLTQGLVRLQVEVGARSRLPLKDLLADNAAIAKAGLTAVSAVPEVLDIQVDKVISVAAVPIELDSKGATLGDVTIVPATTAIQVPQKAWKDIQDRLATQGKKPSLKTALQDLTKETPGTKARRADLAIVPAIEGVPVAPEAKSVTATIAIRQRAAVKSFTVTVRALMPPVWAAADNTAWQDLVLEGKNGSSEWLKTINVSGSTTDLEKLKPEDIVAFFVLREQHKNRSETFDQEKVLFTFPEGLALQVENPVPTVEFRLRKRTEVPTPP